MDEHAVEENSAPFSSSLIPVGIIGGRGHVFDLDHIRILREKHQVCGVLTGILPQFPQQNVFHGLPLELMPEDLQYLMDIGAVEAVSTDGAPSTVDLELTKGELMPVTNNSDQSARADAYLTPSPGTYAMYRFLIHHGCYMMPGLRFGCQLMAYPGDPLRYHAHYNANGYLWQQSFAVLDIVGSGRLGTTVKKSWVVGAHEDDDPQKSYRAFSVEWAGFG